MAKLKHAGTDSVILSRDSVTPYKKIKGTELFIAY